MLNLNKTVTAYYNGTIDYLITFEIPSGFKPIKNASATLPGTVWLYNGYGFFEMNERGERKRLQVVYVEDLQKFKASDFFKKSSFQKTVRLNYAMTLVPKEDTLKESTQCP